LGLSGKYLRPIWALSVNVYGNFSIPSEDDSKGSIEIVQQKRRQVA
jgi:hypothetical protein